MDRFDYINHLISLSVIPLYIVRANNKVKPNIFRSSHLACNKGMVKIQTIVMMQTILWFGYVNVPGIFSFTITQT